MPEGNVHWSLPPEIEARLGEGSVGPQRVIYEAKQLLLVLHEPPGPEDNKRVGVLFLLKEDGSFSAIDSPDGKARLRALLDRYRTVSLECEEMYETANSATDIFKLLERLAPLNRSSTNLAVVLQSAREIAKQDKFFINMRDEGHELSRAFELLVSDSRLALDYRMARNAEAQAERTEQMAKAQHKLNVLAAFTFPVMALATLLGMNLSHGFEVRSPIIFWSVLGSGVCLGFAVKAWVMSGRR